MRLSLSFITSTAPVSRVEAALGGPRSLDVLGHDAADHKVYMLEHFHDGSGDLPQLHFVHVSGAHAGKTVAVRSWYDGDAAEVDARFPQRLARLRRRLTPTREVDTRDWRLRTRVVKRRALRLSPDEPPIRKFTLQLAVSPSPEATAPVAAGAIGTVTAYLRPRARIASVHRIPGERRYLALIRYLGVPVDVGHDRQIALLL